MTSGRGLAKLCVSFVMKINESILSSAKRGQENNNYNDSDHGVRAGSIHLPGDAPWKSNPIIKLNAYKPFFANAWKNA